MNALSRTIMTVLAVAQSAAPTTSAAATDVFQAALDAARDSLEAKGASACVILRDGTTWTGTSGRAYGDEPVTRETRFEAGSITKAFTAAIVLQLADEGILSLDGTIDRWAPDLPEAGRTTLRHLLTHTSGLADPYDNPQLIPSLIADAGRRWEAGEVLEFMGEPVAPPGKTWEYSSANYLLLGIAIRDVTGGTVADAMRQHLFEPLRLDHTVFAAEEEMTGPLAHAFIDVDNDGAEEDLTAMLPSTAFLTAAWTAGAIVSTAADLAVFMRAFGGGEISGPAGRGWVDRGDGNQHGLGVLRTMRHGVTLVGHRGNSAGYSGAVWHAPDEGITVAVLTNKHGVLVTEATDKLLAAALDMY